MPKKRVNKINPTLASQESSCPPLYSPNWGPLGIPVFPVTAHPPPSTKGPTLKPTTGKLSRFLPCASYLQGICFLVETTQPLSTFHNTLFRQRCPLKPAHHSTIKRETIKRTRGLPITMSYSEIGHNTLLQHLPFKMKITPVKKESQPIKMEMQPIKTNLLGIYSCIHGRVYPRFSWLTLTLAQCNTCCKLSQHGGMWDPEFYSTK